MTYGRYADSLLLDPVLNDSNADIWILSNLYDTLLLPTDDGLGLRPGLASSWRVAADGMTVVLTLRGGARFSDGSPITAADVRWSLDRARDPTHGIWSFLLSAIADVDIDDPAMIVLHMRHPDPAILPALSTFNSAIMPQRAFESSAGDDDTQRAASFEMHPVTSGPFMLRSWVRNSSMRLERNPYYWQEGTDGKKLPYLDGVEFQIVPDDATRILKVQSGELDGAELVPFARVAQLARDPRLRVELFASTRTFYAGLNVRPDVAGRPNPLASAKVRQALNEGVYRRGLIQIVTHGLGTSMTSFISRATPMHVDVPGTDHYDPAEARRLLTEAGYPHGFTTTMQIIAGNEDELETATALQEMWSAIGVDLHLRQLDAATWTSMYRQSVFETQISFWTDDIADPEEVTSYDVYSSTNGNQHSGWYDAESERLYLASGVELDRRKRMAEYAQIQARFADGPIVRLFETPYAVVLRRSVQGFVQLPLGNNVFAGAWLAR